MGGNGRLANPAARALAVIAVGPALVGVVLAVSGFLSLVVHRQ
ncbi:hypothetical protein ACFQHN_18510 [Natrialbaceae archaeon GCM10025896]